MSEEQATYQTIRYEPYRAFNFKAFIPNLREYGRDFTLSVDSVEWPTTRGHVLVRIRLFEDKLTLGEWVNVIQPCKEMYVEVYRAISEDGEEADRETYYFKGLRLAAHGLNLAYDKNATLTANLFFEFERYVYEGH